LNARPHPGPLPRGEGESFSVSLQFARLRLRAFIRKTKNGLCFRRPLAFSEFDFAYGGGTGVGFFSRCGARSTWLALCTSPPAVVTPN